MIQAASIDTKTSDRDMHLRSEDFFVVDNHPEITFVSSRITKKGSNDYDVRGTLTIRGVAKEISKWTTLPVTAPPAEGP
jgi:polyisoprenoid-binding protein YceI